MKPDQRLLVALTLTMAILLGWSILFPGPKPPISDPAAVANLNTAMGGAHSLAPTLLTNAGPKEGIAEYLLGSARIGLGKRSGSIQTLKIEGETLLTENQIGLLQTDLISPPTALLDFDNRQEEQSLVSHGSTNGIEIIKIISADDQHKYLYKIKLRVSNQSGEKARLRIAAYKPLYFSEPHDQQYQHVSAWINNKRQTIRVKPGTSQTFEGSPSWISSQKRSHIIVLQPEKPVGLFHVEHAAGNLPVGWLELPPVAPGSEAEWDFTFYAGPMVLSRLKEVGFEEALDLGLFSGVAKFLLNILLWAESWLHNYGLAILFLSFSIWLVFLPMTSSGLRMMKVMGELQPQLERIQKEHKKNPQKMNSEMMTLYRKYRVNPISGCLPLFFQMPIFIALFQVLSRSPELRGAAFLWIKDLSAPDAFIRFNKPIPLLGESLNLLPLVMVGAMFVQQKMTARTRVAVTEEQRMQQQMFQFMPLMFGFFFYSVPSGLVLYWVVNNLLTLTQQVVYFRKPKS